MLATLLPGLGHVYLGKLWTGALVALVVVPLWPLTWRTDAFLVALLAYMAQVVWAAWATGDVNRAMYGPTRRRRRR